MTMLHNTPIWWSNAYNAAPPAPVAYITEDASEDYITEDGSSVYVTES